MNTPGAAASSESGFGARRITRRSLLAGTGAALFGSAVGGLFAAVDWPSAGAAVVQPVVSTRGGSSSVPLSEAVQPDVLPLSSFASSGTMFSLKPAAGLPLLLDPNKGNQLVVTLPLASQGGLTSTTMMPLAGAPTSDYVWGRTVQFQQPFSGPAVNPHLTGITGPQPEWGSLGNRSIDVVSLLSNDGRTWSISDTASLPWGATKSVLESVTGAPSASVDPMALPDAILEWCAADMLATTADGSVFAAGSAVGADLSGSGNNLIVNVGDAMTFHRGPVPGSRAVPSGLNGFPYLAASSARAGMGCSFAGGPIQAWTILVALAPGDQATGGGFDQENVFSTRPVQGSGGVLFALKYGNMGYTWDGTNYNDLSWSSQPFTTSGGAPAPTVVAWSSSSDARQATPSVIAGSLNAPLSTPQAGNSTTQSPRAVAGIDLPSSYGICGVLVYATALTSSQMKAAALRLAYVGYRETA